MKRIGELFFVIASGGFSPESHWLCMLVRLSGARGAWWGGMTFAIPASVVDVVVFGLHDSVFAVVESG